MLPHRFEADRDKGVFSDLPELHALSSGLKATCTAITADGIEAARRSCGGHGYSQLSALPRLYASYVQNVTWEGDNNVLYLQVGFSLPSLYEFLGLASIWMPGVYREDSVGGR